MRRYQGRALVLPPTSGIRPPGNQRLDFLRENPADQDRMRFRRRKSLISQQAVSRGTPPFVRSHGVFRENEIRASRSGWGVRAMMGTRYSGSRARAGPRTRKACSCHELIIIFRPFQSRPGVRRGLSRIGPRRRAGACVKPWVSRGFPDRVGPGRPSRTIMLLNRGGD